MLQVRRVRPAARDRRQRRARHRLSARRKDPDCSSTMDHDACRKVGRHVARNSTGNMEELVDRRTHRSRRGVRMVQVYHTETSKRKSCQLWDQHGGLRQELPNNCMATDKPIAGLLKDLKSRGLLDETLVIWGGEFGRTPMNEARGGSKFLGRDHHPHAFSVWMAGGGIKGGTSYGQTDELGYNIVEDAVDVHDLHATVLRTMGMDHKKLTYRFQGRDYRLTDVSGKVIAKLLA